MNWIKKDEDEHIMVEAFSDSEKKADATLTYYKDPPKVCFIYIFDKKICIHVFQRYYNEKFWHFV